VLPSRFLRRVRPCRTSVSLNLLHVTLGSDPKLTRNLTVVCSCAGDKNLVCGGSSALTLIYDSSIFNADLTMKAGAVVSSAAAAATSAASSGSKIVIGSLPSGFSYISSLIAEGTSGRALNGPSTSSSTMTPAVCSAYCSKAGFAISATEYSSEWYVLSFSNFQISSLSDLSPFPCFLSYCGNSLTNGASLSIPSNATPMPCSGDASITCGAGNALQIVYDSSKVSSSLQAIGGWASSAAPSATAAVNSVGQLAQGYASIAGLIAEGTNGRALTGAQTSSSSMTPAFCSSFCADKGYPISATEYSSECTFGFLSHLSSTFSS
jgi:hypothetical protein